MKWFTSFSISSSHKIDQVICFLSGTNVITFVVFWLFSALYILIDITGRPKWALKFKIQDGQNMPVSIEQNRKTYF